MRWAKAVLKAVAESVWSTVRRVGAFFWHCCKNAMKRPAVLPFAVGLSVLMAWLSPVLAVSVGVVMVNDPEGHPLVRMLLDVAAGAALVSTAFFLPELAIMVAVLPVADICNRFVDSVLRHVEEAERTTTCWELWEQAAERESGLVPSASHA
jgi:hypothetical protein